MRCNPNFPDYYVYQKDDKWFKTDAKLTKVITRRIFAHSTVQLPKLVFYPNWNEQGLRNAKYVAWRVNEDGEQVVRWYWKVSDHSKSCKGCKRMDNGKCAVKIPATIEWNESGKCWSLSPMPSKATESEAKVLDKM